MRSIFFFLSDSSFRVHFRMMDPELFKIAQEQISRMSPAELARIQEQMMSNPELMRMASESMKNMRPEDLRHAAQQLKHTRPEEMAEIGEKMANASPEEIASMRARADAQMSYGLNAAEMLKKQGNVLHTQGRFNEALQKYLLAKQNLEGNLSSQGRTLSLACSVNSMSCYLKTRQYDECIKEGSEVLASDGKNVKALYRRGQAYKEIGQLEAAVQDLTKAHEVSPDDETIAEVLRNAKEKLAREGSSQAPRKLVVEEITEEGTVSSGNHVSSSGQYSAKQPQESTSFSKDKSRSNGEGLKTNLERLEAIRDDPEAIRSFQNFISNADPDTLAAMSGGKAGEVSPDMFKAASNMINKMSPDDLQKMLQLASSFEGETPNKGSFESGFGPGSVPPNVTPDILKTATDMMSKMPPEELHKMFEMASSLKGTDSTPAAATAAKNCRVNSDANSKVSESLKDSASNRNNEVGETSSSGVLPNSRNASESNFPVSTADLQEQMRNQMKDPAMRQMFTSMMKNMSPDMMANMSEQLGLKLSTEEAARAQQAMSSLSPEGLDRMMRWADRIQTGVSHAQKIKNWLLGKPGMILAIIMLILAIIFHQLGYIGR
ncbi:hypothetical protein SLA2020_336890 [Shorea laevis]